MINNVIIDMIAQECIYIYNYINPQSHDYALKEMCFPR